jgi:hypothetical protein
MTYFFLFAYLFCLRYCLFVFTLTMARSLIIGLEGTILFIGTLAYSEKFSQAGNYFYYE